MFEDGTDREYEVVRNHEEQYSIWPVGHPLPVGWQVCGGTGTKAQCLAQIGEVWTDLRPKSVREAQRRAAAQTRGPAGPIPAAPDAGNAAALAANHSARTARWFGVRTRPVNPVARLYCFPHSGGSAGEYLRWADELPTIEVLGAKLPGRGSRLNDPPIANLMELIAALLDDVIFEPPFVLFGHSFGALVAYELTRQLRALGRELPTHLVVSGYGPPHVPRLAPPMSGLPDSQLLSTLSDFYGVILPDLTADPELAAVTLPAYRADLAALENYRYRESPPLPCPLVVFGGDRDVFSREQLAGWERHTAAGYRLRLLPGAHFYFRERPERLLRELRALLTP